MSPQVKNTIQTSIKHESLKDTVNYISGLCDASMINLEERDYWIEETFKYHEL